MKTNSTPFSDVNEILDILLCNVKEILQNQFIGMYLFGSLANGDFDEYSDIDVLIVTDAETSHEQFAGLQQLHARINEIDSAWAIQVEASYISRTALRRFDSANKVHPHMDRGSGEVLHMMAHESDWIIQRYILRERGITIAGPEIRELIDPISPNDLRKAIIDVLPLWSDPILSDPAKISKRGYQSFFVLSLCRMFYTLRYGEIVSKAAAAKWAMDNLDLRWKPLIERALVGRQNPNLDADPEDIHGTLDMMWYMREQTKPTMYPDVNELLNLLLTNVKEILKDQFVGMYLYGSLASGDFNPETSDVDFLVVTEDFLPEATIKHLENMHKQTWATSLKRAGELEGSYVPRSLIRRHDPNGLPCPTVNEGKFFIDQRGSDWIIQRHVVREFGLVVEGPDPKTLIDFVGPQEIRNAVKGILYEWWFPMLDDPSWLRDNENGYRIFAVMTMCRVLHALETGTIVSKPKAIQWARIKLNEPWKQLIDKAALAGHNAHKITVKETLGFIRFIHEQVE